jgi:hypothetical protein
MRGFVGDPRRIIDTPYFTAKEVTFRDSIMEMYHVMTITVLQFMCFLFSHHNELWDSVHNKVNQDMTQPLSHYWIATSHNTYKLFCLPSSIYFLIDLYILNSYTQIFDWRPDKK